MYGDECEYDRRTVLKATVGSATLVGSVGPVTADDSPCEQPKFGVGDYVETNGSDGFVYVYEECEAPEPVGEIENGLCGEVLERCCFETEWRYLVHFDDDRRFWVREPDLTYCEDECGEPAFQTGDYVRTDGLDGTVYGYEECGDPEPVAEIENGHCGEVLERCCFENEWRYLVDFDDFDRQFWVREIDLSYCISTD